MNRPIVMAQLGGATPVQAQAVRTIKLAKPADNQAQTVFLGYDQKFKLDLSAIANEKITFVHVGERLIILFDNQSTLTIDPFFDSAGAPRNNIAFDVNGREIDGSQFAATFPITNDQSVLPAAGDAAGGSPASGANFGDATVDPFGARTALDLLGQEELGTFVINDLIGQLIENFLPEVSANDDLVLDEDGLAGGNLAGLGDLDPATNGPVTLAGTLAHDYGNDDAGSLLLLGTDAPNGFTYILNGAGTVLTVIQNQDGVDVEVLRITLADTTSGNYTIEHLNAIRHAAADNENDQTFVFNYRVTDSNGDSVDGTLNLTVDDDTPTVAANPPVQLDDESASLPYDLPNAGGTGDADPDTANLAGTLALSFGADGGSVEWLADVIFTGGAAGLTAEVDPVTGALLIIQDQSGTAVTVLTVTLDASNGNYTVTHNAPMLHAPGDNENDQSFTLTYRVTDKDGDTADGTLTIDLDDDTPTIEVTVAEGEGSSEGGPGASLVLMPLDESIGDDSSDFDADFDDVPGNTTPDPTGTNPIGRTGTFVPPGGGQGQIGMLFNVTASPGVDGAQSITQVVSLTLTGSVGGPGVATTLTNTALAGVPSDTIYLFQISETEVVGVVGSDPAGDVALRITLLNPNDPAAAQLVVEQYLPIDHGADGNDFDSSLAMTLAEPGSSLGLTLTATVIDNDGDPATSSATIVFADQETSSVNIQDDGPSFNADAAAVARRVEEDAMTLPSAGNEGGNGHPDTQDGNKQAGDNSNQDQRSGPSGSLSPLVNFGTDGPAANGGFSITMTQSVLDALPTLYSGGAPVAYSSTGSILTAIDSNGQVVFTLTVNADGSWKFDLDGQLDHVDDAPNGENFRLRTDAAGTTSVPNIDFSSIIVATDGDGDSITGLAPGKFRIRVEDDVPTIVPPGGDAGANLITNGSFETGHGLANNDYDTFLSIPGWTAGDNGTPGDPNDDVPFEIQVGSTIGDLGPQDGQAKAELDSDLVGTGADGNPTGFTNATMQQTVGGTVAGQLYELSFYYSTRPSDGDAGSSSFEVLWNGAVVYTVDSTGVPVGWQHITLSLIATGPDSVLAFRATGQENSLGAYIDNVSLVAQAAAVVDEDGLSGPYSVGNNDSAPGDDTAGNGDGDDNEATATGSLGIVWGADAVDAADVGTTALGGLVQDTVDAAGDRSVVFTSATPTISGIAGPLTSHGDTLSYALTDGGTRLVATAPDGREVFEVTLSDDGSGRFRFVLNDQLDHAPGQSENNLALAFGYTATDSDSDSVTGSFVISIDDDMPTLADVAPIIRTVDEDDIRTPWSTGTSPNDGAGDGSITENSTGAAFISGSLTSLVSIGADEFPAGNENPIFGFVDGIAGQMTALGLYSKHSAQPATENGLPLTYQTSTDGDWVVLSAFEPDTPAPGNTGNPVFELRVNQLTGDYEFRLFDELMHQLPAGFPNSADENFVLRSGADGFVDAIDFGSFITVTDFDDDQITLNGQFQIQIRDDIPDPDIVVNPLGVVQHDETSGVQFILDSDTNESTVKALFADLEASGNVGDDLDVSGDTNGGVAGNGAIGYAQSVFSIVSALGSEAGADSPPAASAFSLTIVGGAETDLTLTDGSRIELIKEGDLIVGRVVDQMGVDNYVGQAAFAIAITPDGRVSLAQYLSLNNPVAPDNFDESVDLDGKIAAVFTITDSDGDTSSDSVGIGSRIRFDDDGPKVEMRVVRGAHLIHDETPGIDASDDDVDGATAFAGSTLAAVFAGIDPSAGDDTDVGDNPIGYALSTSPVFSFPTLNYGADGPAAGNSIRYELRLGSGNVHSGLRTTDGFDIHLFKEGDLIVGRYEPVGDTPDGSADEVAAFAISIDPATGQLAMVQYVSLRHPDASNPYDTVTLNDGTLSVRVTLTDGDGDTDSDTVDISDVVQFEDDGPTFGDATDAAVDEDDLANGNSDVAADDDLADPSPTLVTVSGSFGVNFGADGPAASNAISGVAFSPALTSDDLPVSMHLDGGVWYGRAGGEGGADVFSLAFDTTTGEYSFTLLGNLDHPAAGTEDNIVLDFTFTATDFDGDTATGSFSIDVDDDMPVTTPAANLLVNGDFVGGTFEGQGDFPNSFPWGDNGHGGTDTNGIEGWAVTGGQAERVGNTYLGMTTSNGNPMLDMAASPGNIQIAQTVNGLTIGQTYAIQFEAGAPVPSSALLEVYWDNVLIATIDTAGPMTSYVLSVVAAGASGSLSFREVGLDNATSVSPTPGTHGHHGTYLANIGLVQVATVDEDGLTLANSHGNAEGIGDDTQIGDAPTNSSAVTQSLGIRWGADDNDSGADPDGVQDTPDGTGDRSLTFTNALVTIGGAATLTSNGDPVSYEVVDNGTRLVGYVNSGDDGYTDGDRLVFEVTLSDDGSGSFTFTLRDNLDHAQGNNENDISLAFNYTATDSDGDTATGSFAVVVDDDMPVAGENVVAFTDDETAETPDAEPNLGGTDDYGGNPPANLTGTLAHAYGADGAGSTLLLDTPTSGFTYALNGNGTILTISQVQGDSPVDVLRVTLTDTVSGDYTIEHLNEIDHSAPGASEENLVLSVNYRVTDDDGDTVDGSLSINVDDDTPTVVADSICEATPAEPGGVANFVLVLDTSGSIESDQLSLIQDSVENLLNQIGSSGAQDVRVHIVQFGSTASPVGTYDIISGGTLNATALAEAIADVNAMTGGGNTNYEAGLQQALRHIQGGSQTIEVDELLSSPDANGASSDGVTRLVGNNGQHIALISGWETPGTTSGDLINANGSITAGWGASDGSNDQIDPGQLVRFDFGAFNNFSVGSFGNPGGFNGVPVLSATFTLQDNSSFLASTNFTYTIHFADGSPAESDTINVGNSTNVTLAGTGGNLGREVAYIQFTVGNGDEGDVDLQSITTMPAAPGTLAGADVNSLIFISDGEPNRALDDSGNVITVSTQNAIDQILGVDDPSNEVGDVEGNSGGLDQAFTIEVFNVGPTTKTLTIDGSDANNNDVNAAGGFNDNNATNDDDAVILTANGTAVALVSGWLSTSTAIGNLVDANGGTSGIGVQDSNSNLDGDDQLDTNQVLRFDFGAPADYDGAGNYSAANIGFNGPPVSSASFEFDSFGSGSHTIDYRVFYTNNTSDPGFTSVNFSGGDVTQVITAPPGLFIDYIEFVNTGSGDGQIDLQSVVTPSSALALLDQVEGSGGSAETITSPGDLANSLSALIASLAGTPGGEEDCGPIVVHDETAGVQNMADPNAQTDVTGATLLAGGAAIASLFAGVAFTGVDLHAASLDNGAIGFARSGAGISPVTLTANFGADGPAGVGSISHVLSIPGGEVANGSVYSGLDTTEGRRIYLFQEDGLIVGRVDADDDNEATSTDEAAFAIAIDALSGELYVAQYLSLENPIAGSGTVPPGSHDEQIRILEDAIQVTVTVTDHDNDTASSDPISIGGFIAFHDGGPTANDDDARDVAEDAVAISGNVLTNDVAGADGATLTHVQLPGGSFVEITSGLQEPAGVYSHVVAGLGTYTFSASGAWTFDPVINPSASAVNGTFDYRITDGDGDTSEGVQPITVLNSNEPPTVGALTMRVSEEGLTAANPDTSGNTDTTNSATDSAALPVADPDGDTLTVTFGDPGAVLTSNNQPVTWSGVGTGMLVGSVGSTTIITLAIVGTTINVELSGPVDHPDPTQEDEIGFAVPINVSDGQETTPGSVSVVIEDDAPDTFSPADSAIFNIASSVTAALDVADNVGADTPPTVSFDGIDNGDPATGSIGGNPLSTLTSNGLPIFLYNFGTVLIGTTQVMADPAGVDEIADLNSGSFVFSVTLDPDVGDNNYTFEMLGTIDNGSGVSFSNFAEIGSPGNNNFVAADQPSGTDLVIQATVTGSTANTATFGSSVDFGVNNQSINAAQGLILDFVTLLPVVNSAADYSGHNTVNGVSFTMAQIQGNNTTADVFVRAFNADDDGDFEPRLGDGGDTVVTITGISINGVMLTPVALAALDVLDPDGFGNGLVLENLSEIDVVVVFTSSGFDRLQISNAVDLGGANAYDGNPFSVTAFAVATVESGEPVTLNFDVRLTDSDGDSTVADFEVVVAPPATPPTVAVDIVDASLSDADPSSLVTFQFDQDVAGFDEADLTAVGGTLSNFTVVDDNTYEVTFTADGGFSGTGSVTVGTGYTDISGTVAGATGSDTVAIAANTTPVANDDIVISNFGGSTFTVPEWAFLANDTDADGDPLDIQGVNDEFGLATLSHSAGSGTNGTITINDNSFAGGTFDYVATDGTATSEGDVTYVQDSNSITGTSADEIIVGDDDGDTFNGNGGNDVILAGGGNDTIVGDQSDYVLDGGGDTDTLQVGANFTSTGNGQIVSIEKIVLTAANTTLNLSNQTEALRIVGSSGVDTITGGSGADIITGGAGNDIVTGGLGTDQFRLQTNGGVDAISDFTVGTDRIGLFDDGSTGSGSVNFAGTGGSAAGTALAAGDFQIRNAITAIQGGDDNHVVLINTAQTTAQIAGANGANNSQNIYVVVFNSTTGRGEIWFDSDWDNDPAGRVQVATLSSITSLAQLTALTAADFVVYNSATDPLVLDLGAPGLDFAGLENGVSFDINADGALDQIAWTTGEDGILGLDVDGNGTIDNGGEIFSPYFAGGDYASSLAALASLDANGDGVMDANDAAFASLTVWQDANHDGISEASELSSLADRGITSIDLSATPADSTIDGQQVVSEGTFTTAGGGSGTFVEVAFDTSLAPGANDGPQTFALDNANAAEIISGYSAARGDIIDVSGLLEANFASDSNLSDFVNVLQDGSDVTIQIDQNGPASGAHFVDVAVLQGYGSSASDIVRIAFESAEYQVAV